MPALSPHRTIKTWRRHVPKEKHREIPRMTRGLYVLYKKHGTRFEVRYIGIGGLGRKSAIGGRISAHTKRKDDWTHFSYFEVHDNVTGDEIRDLEALILQIFGDDPRITNVQIGSRKLASVLNAEHAS